MRRRPSTSLHRRRLLDAGGVPIGLGRRAAVTARTLDRALDGVPLEFARVFDNEPCVIERKLRHERDRAVLERALADRRVAARRGHRTRELSLLLFKLGG